MRNHARRLLALLLACAALMGTALAAPLEEGVPVEITSPSAMLLEADTGTVIFEKNADEKRQVASVTKLMTLLLCFEELEAGRVSLEDDVTVSQAAAAQIGSQALLDANAVYKFNDLLHATIIASANDAAYALAADAIIEYITNGIESAMCKYNTKKKKPAPSEGAAQ